MSEPIVVTVEETGHCTSLTVNAAEIEVYPDGDRTAIQLFDVDAWCDASGEPSGDPVAGCQIWLAPGQPLMWAKALGRACGFDVVEIAVPASGAPPAAGGGEPE